MITREYKKLQLEDWAFIFFVYSRIITWIFTSILGTKGVLLSMAFMFLLYIAVLIKKIKEKDLHPFLLFLIIAMLVTLLALISATGDRFRAEWMLDIEHGLFTKVFDPRKGIFALFLVLMIGDVERIKRDFQLASYILAVYLTMHVILFLFKGNWSSYFSLVDNRSANSSYNLHLGYGFVTCFLVLEDKYLTSHLLQDKIFSLLCIFNAFYFGPRGIIIVIIAFYVLQLLFNSDREKKKVIAKSIVTSIVFIIAASLGLKYLRMFIANILPSWSINEMIDEGSRTINSLKSGEISESNGRLTLWGYSIDAIKDSPIFGHGLFGDRPYVGKRFQWGYSHNMLLELWASFGIFGVSFFLFIVYLVLKYLISDKYKNERSFIIITVASCVKLLLSDSFWYLDMFWIFIGIALILELNFNNFSTKMFSTITASMFLINAVCLGNYLRVAAARQINYAYKAEKPTAVIAFEGTNLSDYYSGFNYLHEKGITGTSFISGDLVGKSGYLSEDIIIEMNQAGWDFQDNLYYSDNLYSTSQSKFDRSIEKSDKFFRELHIDNPVAMSDVNNFTNQVILSKHLDERNVFARRTFSSTDGMYTKIPSNYFFNLYMYEPRMTSSTSEESWEILRENIRENKERNGIFLIKYREIQVMADDQVGYQKYFEQLVDILVDEGYEFKTIREISDEVRMPENEKTVKNLILNYGFF